jgi:two-component system, sensor histidine kinase
MPLLQGPAAAAPADAPRPAPGRRRILVVDDNVDAADCLTLLLQQMGHEVLTVNDGPAALREAAAFAPDLVLLDIGLPGMTGYEVARALRANPSLQGVVLVAETGWGQAEDRRRSAEAGFDHHLVKPIELADLERILRDLP